MQEAIQQALQGGDLDKALALAREWAEASPDDAAARHALAVALAQSGDPDADPSGLLMKTLQATAIIAFTPKLVEITFTFGTKLTNDITGISGGTVTNPWTTLLVFITGVDCIITVIIAVLTLIAVLIIGLQTLIRGAELALLSVLGPVLALNLTSDNRGTWNVWVKHLIVLCCSQAMQIFMYKGAMVLLTYELSLTNMFFLLGWMWVTVMTPRFMKQFIYSSGIGSAGMSVGRTLLLRRALK